MGETYYFNRYYDRGEKFYQSFMRSQPGQILFEKTPTYYKNLKVGYLQHFRYNHVINANLEISIKISKILTRLRSGFEPFYRQNKDVKHVIRHAYLINMHLTVFCQK